MKKPGMIVGIAIGAAAAVLVATAVWLIVVYTGAYNVAASDRHADIVRWSFDTTMRRSVSGRAEDIEVPEPLPPELVAAGAQRYAAMCQHCHAGPGVERAGWADGMLPTPPHLTEAAADWEAREVFWIVQNGIKMTGMPAFGDDQGEQAILEIAAFVKQLPGMTPEQYRELTGGGHGDGGQQSGGQGAGGQQSGGDGAGGQNVPSREPAGTE